MLRRRDFIRSGIAGAGALALGPGFWEAALAAGARPGRGPYGPLGDADGNGIRLPSGFSSRVVGRANQPVAGTGYPWHVFPDGGSTFATRDGGWILVSNSEVPRPADVLGEVGLVGNPGEGGASAVRFASDGTIRDAYRILSGTSTNCAGGATPWRTWLSCEEVETGRVWECDPRGRREPTERPALGVFKHEAVCVDRRLGQLYLSEDLADGGLYRFTPKRAGDLAAGRLEIAQVGREGHVRWRRVPDPLAQSRPTREQVAGATEFRRGEGIWYDRGFVYLATTADSSIHAYDVRRGRIRKIYDAARLENPPLTDVDNITVSRAGDLYVCEDNGGDDPFDICIITAPPKRRVARVAKLTGPEHGNPQTGAASEVTGVCFDPVGQRMYFSSQRAFGLGVTYEVSGPFRRRPPA